MSSESGQPGAQPSNRTIFTADNLPVLRGIDSETIDLIYLDPPFNTGKQWHAPIGSDAEGASFNDIWAWDDVAEAHGETLATSVKRQWVNDLRVESPVRAVVDTADATAGEEMGAYLAFMAMRLVEMERVLKSSGSIYLHCDPIAGHYLKLLMDAIFGRSSFDSEIIWRIGWVSGFKTQKKGWIRNHDTILYYTKSSAAKQRFNKEYLPYPPDYVRRDGKKPTGKGIPIEDTWNCSTGDVLDSIMIKSFSTEKTGYPTQKPLALLERIVKASSSPGDVVLDPFCGCATACVAAEKLGRRWIGIDVSELAVLLCDDRIQKMQNQTGQVEFGIPYHDPIHRTDIPQRSDTVALVNEMPIDLSLSKDVVKQRLYEQQAGICNGCERHFPPEFADLLDLDHIKARSKGGLHTWSNVQLLCRTCNVRKGSGTMAQLRKRLSQEVA